MAGLLNTIYLVIPTLVAVVGLVFVASTMRDADPEGSSWVDWSMMIVTVLFLIGLAAGMVT